MALDNSTTPPLLSQPSPESYDLSAGTHPSPQESEKAQEILNDAKARRRFRLASTTLAIGVVAFLCGALFCVIQVLTAGIALVTVASVGMVVTLTVAITVLTIALLRSTFASISAVSDANSGIPAPPAEVLKAVGGAIEAVGKVLSSKA